MEDLSEYVKEDTLVYLQDETFEAVIWWSS